MSDLKDKNYLKENIKNDQVESCMENSYVKVYKLSNTEYTYTTFLYCGNEEVPLGTRTFKKYSLEHPYGGHGYCGKSGTIYKS